jgi:hypothetical protein
MARRAPPRRYMVEGSGTELTEVMVGTGIEAGPRQDRGSYYMPNLFLIALPPFENVKRIPLLINRLVF